ATREMAKTDKSLPYVRAVLASDQYEDLVSWTPFLHKEILSILRLKAHDVVTRAHAARVLGLGRQNLTRIIEALAEIVRDPNEHLMLRIDSAVALGRLAQVAQTPRIFDELRPALDDPEPRLQDEVITAVGRSRHDEALEVLLAHWNDRGGAAKDR